MGNGSLIPLVPRVPRGHITSRSSHKVSYHSMGIYSKEYAFHLIVTQSKFLSSLGPGGPYLEGQGELSKSVFNPHNPYSNPGYPLY